MFWKTRKYQRFLRSSTQTIGSKREENAVIYRGLAPSRAKKLRKYKRFGVQKWPKHRYLQCFVPSTVSWNYKNIVNTSIFCDQPAKNAVIYSVFCFAFKYTGICNVLCISGLKVLVFTVFSAFLHVSTKDVKTQKCCNLQHFVNFEKRKMFRKMCPNGAFFRF